MSDQIPNVDVSKALADMGEVPRITNTQPPAGEHGSIKLPIGQLDKFKTAWDPDRHSCDAMGNPKMTSQGLWARKRGKGSPKMKARFAAEKEERENAGSGDSYVVPPDHAQANAPGDDEDNVADSFPDEAPAQNFGESDYEGTAVAITNGLFGIMCIFLGPAWTPDAEESNVWRGAWRRLFHQCQWPRIGPVFEIIMLLPATIAKRREDARTKAGWAKVKAWIGIKPPADEQGQERKAA